MSNYFDNSHIDGKQLTPQQIADAIRHKKFGVDVREAMAQGLEYCMTQAQKVDKLEQDLSNLDERVTALEVLPSEIAEVTSEVAEVKRDISNLDKRVTALEVLPSEVSEIKRDIGMINKQIDKLNLAVFGDGATEVQTISSNQENHSQLAKEVKLD